MATYISNKFENSGSNVFTDVYPTSVFLKYRTAITIGQAINQPLPSLAEYIDAKHKGEEFCADLKRLENNYIVCPRLSRIKTGQTLSLIKVA